MIKTICMCICYLHSIGIYHRSLKPECIFINDSQEIKIGGFEISVFLPPNGSIKNFTGSVAYSPPEMFEGVPLTKEADMWQLGLLFYFIICGRLPFRGNSTEELVHQIMYNEVSFTELEWVDISDDPKSMIKALLSKKAEERPTINEILACSWMRKQPS